jgi:hypothetical protein
MEEQPHHSMDAFRDYQRETQGLRSTGGSQGLAGLYQAPSDMLFKGSFEAAQEHAVNKEQWLLVNVQSNEQFASHQLNRDTWSDPTVKDIIQNSFVFWQVYASTEQGHKFCHFYRLESEHQLPAILVIDPITGSCPKQMTGFKEPERLMEELVPFMDASIHDPPPTSMGRRPAQKRSTDDAAAAASSTPMTDDEMLQAALAASMAGSASAHGMKTSTAGPSTSAAATATAAQAPSTRSAAKSATEASTAATGAASAEVVNGHAGQAGTSSSASEAKPHVDAAAAASEAKARLPAQVPAGTPGSVRTAIRLPTGQRLTAVFPGDTRLEALYDLCISEVPDAATGIPFALRYATPGPSALTTDKSQTLQAAGVNGAMLSMAWT